MDIGELIEILRSARVAAPRTLRSAIAVVERILRDRYGALAIALDLPADRAVYLSRLVPGIDRETLASAIGIAGRPGYRWVIVDLDGTSTGNESPPPLHTKRIPISGKGEERGGLFLLSSSAGIADGMRSEHTDALSEVLSVLLGPFTGNLQWTGADEEVIREELLESTGNDRMMRSVLLRMMELSGADFCAYYTAGEDGLLYMMIEGRELSPRIPEIREKLRTTYRMFTNSTKEPRTLQEKVFIRRREGNIALLLGSSRIESYFLIPVSSQRSVAGVLFFGSVKRDAFTRENIDVFHRLAEGGRRGAVVYRDRGDIEVLEKMITALPFGAALIGPDGRLMSANRRLHEELGVNDIMPARIQEIGLVSRFNLQGVWEEFSLLGRNLIDRELRGDDGTDRSLAVTWIGLGNLSQEVGSLLIVRDITESMYREEAGRELIATVAHELRTPLTALRHSLKIMMEEGAAAGGGKNEDIRFNAGVSERFLKTALRTLHKLNMLVDGLIDSSAVRRVERILHPANVDVREFIDEAAVLYVESMRRKGIAFSITVEESLPRIEMDRDRMEQVIQNLLSNSIKHTPAGGSIEIAAAPSHGGVTRIFDDVPWGYLPDAMLVEIRVTDSGRGIPREVADLINERGGQRPKGAKPGLGLVIAKRLVELHGGAIAVDEGYTAGARVHCYVFTDMSAGAMVRSVRVIKERVRSYLDRGLTPTLYTIVKESPRCWLEIVGNWPVPPVVDPDGDEIPSEGFYIWPLAPGFALGLTPERRFANNPIAVAGAGRGRMRVLQGDEGDRLALGWAVGPRDGSSYGELIARALERIAAEEYAAL